jgi:hypothetical protein
MRVSPVIPFFHNVSTPVHYSFSLPDFPALAAVDPALVELLSQGRVVIHPFVLGELACGNLRNRAQTLADFGKLPSTTIASDSDAYHLLESHRLWG